MIDVLIIDDDPVFGELMVDRLGAAGLRASFHHGWFQSLIRVREEQPKLLIIDVNMPAMSGTSLWTRCARTWPDECHRCF